LVGRQPLMHRISTNLQRGFKYSIVAKWQRKAWERKPQLHTVICAVPSNKDKFCFCWVYCRPVLVAVLSLENEVKKIGILCQNSCKIKLFSLGCKNQIRLFKSKYFRTMEQYFWKQNKPNCDYRRSWKYKCIWKCQIVFISFITNTIWLQQIWKLPLVTDGSGNSVLTPHV
jgi:hypothetical protein